MIYVQKESIKKILFLQKTKLKVAVCDNQQKWYGFLKPVNYDIQRIFVFVLLVWLGRVDSRLDPA